MSELLAAHSLSVAYEGAQGRRAQSQVLLDVTLELSPGQIVGLAGESGSGKSTFALALMGYRPAGQSILRGEVDLDGASITGAAIARLRRVWGSRLAYLPQDTSTSLNPALSIGRHFVESLRKHQHLGHEAGLARAADWLGRVDIPQPEAALRRYPHQFSGGQQQRIAVALALCLGPDVLILDEPTTGLDVVTQARVNEVVVSLARDANVAMLYVSHNLAMLATVCDELAIMYAGQIVEQGPVSDLYLTPRHPYTAALLAAVPTIESDERPRGIPGVPRPTVALDECAFITRCPLSADVCRVPVPMVAIDAGHDARCVRLDQPLPRPARAVASVAPDAVAVAHVILQVSGATCTFGKRVAGVARALDDVSVELAAGRTLGIAGESGSGKSTLLKVIAGLIPAERGTVQFVGETLAPLSSRRSIEQRRALQIVFQNPDSTLNPRHTIAQSLERPLRLFATGLGRSERRARLAGAMEQVQMSVDLLDRYPRDLSGGQRQRIAIARALLADPIVLLCDEVTSALDVSVQASILELLVELRESRQLAMIFVTHDLGVLRNIADETVVMQNGTVRERGPVATVLRSPRDGYTKRLIEAIPTPFQDVAAATTGGQAGKAAADMVNPN